MTNQPDLQTELDFAIQIAAEAGQRVLGLRQTGRWEGKTLADIGDQAADGLLQGYIRGRFPEDGLLSEETVDSPERTTKQRAWIVDPLDGTKEYSQGRDDWAVHVALTIAGRCALGVVALPAVDEILWGISTEGAERHGSINGMGMSPGDAPSNKTLKVMASRSHTPPWMERFGESMGAELVPCGSVGFKVSRLLVGEADLYLHKIGLKEWDTCAPEAIARALGWHVCKLRGDAHTYNQLDPKNHELVVCRPALKDRVLAAIADCGALEDD